MLSKLIRFVALTLCLSEALAECQMKGVNIAGFDFGCATDGTCVPRHSTPPFLSPGKWELPHIKKYNYYSDGIGQMQHFSKADGLNIYRLPVSWQFLLNYTLGGHLDHNAFGLYNDLVQGCLKTGSYCIIDIHNYARWEGPTNIIGQGGPSNREFADVWRQLAQKYKNEPKIIFGLMNEPHNLDMEIWSDTVQYVVNAIRKAGANSHMIFLPGTRYTNAHQFEKFSAPPLTKVKNPDGSYHNLIYEVHKYFGTNVFNGECVTDHVEDVFKPLAKYLKENNRKAFVAELGGGSSSDSCRKYICKALKYINHNSDVYLGFTAWSAGAFRPSYPYNMSPNGSAEAGWIDQPLLTNCIKKNFYADAKKWSIKKHAGGHS